MASSGAGPDPGTAASATHGGPHSFEEAQRPVEMHGSAEGRDDRRVDILIVSLGATAGLRSADAELADSMARAGASVALVAAARPRSMRTLALTDLAWALAARRAAAAGLAEHAPRAIVYSSTTSALLWPRPGAIRFDATSSGNRPGRHGLWQRPLERHRLAQSSLLLPWSTGGLEEAPAHVGAKDRLVLPVPVEPSGPPAPVRDVTAVTYAANPLKKGLDRVLAAWTRVRRPEEHLYVAGVSAAELARAGIALPSAGITVTGPLASADYRALLRRARVFVSAPRREDHGLAQLEALADGCELVTTPAPGPYAALPIARSLDPRLVSDDLGVALRSALDDPVSDYRARASLALAAFSRASVDRLVAEALARLLLRG
jgi:hypothetical protein